MGEIVFLFNSSFSAGDLATCFTQFKAASLFFTRENRLESENLSFFSSQSAQADPPILQLAWVASLSYCLLGEVYNGEKSNKNLLQD